MDTFTTMKTPKFSKKTMAIINKFLTYWLYPLLSFFGFMLILKCLSKLKHDLKLFFFYNRIRNEQFTKMCKSFTTCFPGIRFKSGIFRCLSISVNRGISSKYICNPIYKAFISACDLQKRM